MTETKNDAGVAGNVTEDAERSVSRAWKEAFLEVGRSPAEQIEIHVGQRVRKVRESKGLTLQDLCRRAEIDLETLTGIEEGTIDPPLGQVIRLAKALEMRMGYFVSGLEEKSYTIVRRNDRKLVSRHDAAKARHYGYQFESLAPNKGNRHMEPFLVTLEPSATEHERSTHEGQEFLYVLEGEMEVRLGGVTHLLESGDAIYLDSGLPHLVKCHGSRTAKVLAVLYAEK